MKRLFIAMAALQMIISSCQSSSDEPTPSGAADIKILATVQTPVSRAGLTSENLTDFGLIVANAAAPTFSFNTKITGTAGNWAAADGTPLLWDNELNAVEALAFAPWHEGVTGSETALDVSVSADQSTEAAVAQADFLLMPKTTVDPKTTNEVLAVMLGHKMAKLVIKVDAAATEMEIRGLKPGATIDLTTAAAPVTVTGETASITPYAAGNNTYEAIVVPQQLDSRFSIAFKVGENSYHWDYTGSAALAMGYQYTVNLSLAGGHAVQLAGNISCTDWNTGATGNLTFSE